MKLYVTDLDGTLLNSKEQVSEYTKKSLNELIDNGLNFTVATARTPATAVDIVKDLNLNLPLILMNGVIIYDMKNNNYLSIREIKKESANKVLDVFLKFNQHPLMYGIKENHLWVYHKEFKNAFYYNFYKERVNKPLKTFVEIADYKVDTLDSKVINFIVFDKKEVIENIAKELKGIDGILINYYQDIYNKDCYLLEVHNEEGTKANGIKYLKNYINYDNLTCFGDNSNDIAMFKIADVSCATDNAIDEVKSIATHIIGHCENDGVVKYLKQYFNNK